VVDMHDSDICRVDVSSPCEQHVNLHKQTPFSTVCCCYDSRSYWLQRTV